MTAHPGLPAAIETGGGRASSWGSWERAQHVFLLNSCLQSTRGNTSYIAYGKQKYSESFGDRALTVFSVVIMVLSHCTIRPGKRTRQRQGDGARHRSAPSAELSSSSKLPDFISVANSWRGHCYFPFIFKDTEQQRLAGQSLSSVWNPRSAWFHSSCDLCTGSRCFPNFLQLYQLMRALHCSSQQQNKELKREGATQLEAERNPFLHRFNHTQVWTLTGEGRLLQSQGCSRAPRGALDKSAKGPEDSTWMRHIFKSQ